MSLPSLKDLWYFKPSNSEHLAKLKKTLHNLAPNFLLNCSLLFLSELWPQWQKLFSHPTGFSILLAFLSLRLGLSLKIHSFIQGVPSKCQAACGLLDPTQSATRNLLWSTLTPPPTPAATIVQSHPAPPRPRFSHSAQLGDLFTCPSPTLSPKPWSEPSWPFLQRLPQRDCSKHQGEGEWPVNPDFLIWGTKARNSDGWREQPARNPRASLPREARVA